MEEEDYDPIIATYLIFSLTAGCNVNLMCNIPRLSLSLTHTHILDSNVKALVKKMYLSVLPVFLPLKLMTKLPLTSVGRVSKSTQYKIALNYAEGR